MAALIILGLERSDDDEGGLLGQYLYALERRDFLYSAGERGGFQRRKMQDHERYRCRDVGACRDVTCVRRHERQQVGVSRGARECVNVNIMSREIS